jgi:hypothetical protein
MRCFVVLLCALVLASGKDIPSIKASSEVRVIGKELYSSINKKDTLKGWPSEEIKKLAGSDAWDGWRPSEGDIGKMAHIWAGMGMALVHIDNHYVVMGEWDPNLNKYCNSPSDVFMSFVSLGNCHQASPPLRQGHSARVQSLWGIGLS